MTSADALQPAIVYLGAGLAAAVVARAVRLSPIVGYLLAGVVIGPSGLGLVQRNETTAFLAELGVVFLLFDIGLHFSLKEIRTRRRDMIGLAPLQILLCGAAFTGLGLLVGFDPPVATVVGVSLALSSTAVVARILSDRNLPGCPMGRSATAVLVAQDIVAIFLLAFAASLGGAASSLGLELATTLGYATASLIAAILVGRFLIRPLFSTLAATHNEEAFTVVALFVVLAASAATAQIGLSLTLGAFLAGMAIADTPYRHVVQTEIAPFRGLLLGLFFLSVGMGVNLALMAPLWPFVLLCALVIMGVKTAMIFLAARLTRWSPPGATQLAFLLSQGSEFTLVAVGVAAVGQALPGVWASALIAAVALTLAAAPLWWEIGAHISRWLAKRSKADIATPASVAEGERNVIVFGMSEEGRFCVDALRDLDIPCVALDSDPDRFVAARSDGYEVIYGDAADLRLMELLGVERALAFVIAAPRIVVAEAMAPEVTARFPDLPRFVAVRSAGERLRYSALGMRAHLSVAEPRGVELTTDLLAALGVAPERISAWLEDQIERRHLGHDETPEESVA